MRREDISTFRAALAEIRSLPRDDHEFELIALFLRHAFAPKTPEIRGAKRRCRVPAITIADLSTYRREAMVQGYVKAAHVPSGGSSEIVWCPELNTLILVSMHWTAEDSYLRIRSQKESRYSLLDEAEAVLLVMTAWGSEPR